MPSGRRWTYARFAVREDGYVEIVRRIKDMIIRGGESIHPREIEEFPYGLKPTRTERRSQGPRVPGAPLRPPRPGRPVP